MNNAELKSELSQNESDKKLAKAELEASQRVWVNYVLQNKTEICSNIHPVPVKKKRSARWKEFTNTIKKIFGFTPRKETVDGIETYLQYRNDFE